MAITRKNDAIADIIAVSVSENRGGKKYNVDKVELKENYGILGDAHAGSGDRQISLLAVESINKMKDKGADVYPGDFAENITTKGINLVSLDVGTVLKLGRDAEIKITKIGKECKGKCSIYYSAGTCVMPEEGIFAVVTKSGIIYPKDKIVFVNKTEKINV